MNYLVVLILSLKIKELNALKLSQPSVVGKEGNGIGQTCYDSTQKFDIEVIKDLYIVMSSLVVLQCIIDYQKDLQKKSKLQLLNPRKKKLKSLLHLKENSLSRLKDPFFLFSFSNFESIWTTKTEYEEFSANF